MTRPKAVRRQRLLSLGYQLSEDAFAGGSADLADLEFSATPVLVGLVNGSSAFSGSHVDRRETVVSRADDLWPAKSNLGVWPHSASP